MSATLVIPFRARKGPVLPGESWWLRIVPVELEPDTASVSEVADLLDDLYGLEPCNPDLDQQGGKGQEVDPATGKDKPPVEEDEFRAKVAEHLDFLACQVNDRGDYEAQVKIYRSHPSEPYKLVVLGGGEVVQTIKIQEEVTVAATVDKQWSLDLGMPVLSGMSATWGGTVYTDAGPEPGPEITVNGSVLSFGAEVTGRITATFRTEYDLVTVRIDGDDGQPRPARLVAFYHNLAWEGDVDPPNVPDEDPANVACPGEGPGAARCAEHTCWKHVHHYSRCACTGKTVGEYDEAPQQVPCPDDWCFGYDGENLHEHVFDGYVAGVEGCPETTGRVWDPAYYEQVCCQPPEVDLPRCKVVRRRATGGKEIEGGVQAAKRKYGPNARFVAVTPSDGDCGTITVRQQIIARNCCDEVEPLAWDYDNSATVVAPSSFCYVFVLGGKLPIDVKLRGAGFWLDENFTIRDGQLNSRTITIYTDEDACGTASIYVTDGCTSVSEELKSTVGKWDGTEIDLNDCPFTGHAVYSEGEFSNRYTITNGNSTKKLVITFSCTDCREGGGCTNCRSSGISSCNPPVWHAKRCSDCNGYTCTVNTDETKPTCRPHGESNTCITSVDAVGRTYTMYREGVYEDMSEICEADNMPGHAVVFPPGSMTKKVLYEWVC